MRGCSLKTTVWKAKNNHSHRDSSMSIQPHVATTSLKWHSCRYKLQKSTESNSCWLCFRIKSSKLFEILWWRRPPHISLNRKSPAETVTHIIHSYLWKVRFCQSCSKCPLIPPSLHMILQLKCWQHPFSWGVLLRPSGALRKTEWKRFGAHVLNKAA